MSGGVWQRRVLERGFGKGWVGEGAYVLEPYLLCRGVPGGGEGGLGPQPKITPAGLN